MKFWGFKSRKERQDAHMDQLRAAAYLQGQSASASSGTQSTSSSSDHWDQLSAERRSQKQHELAQCQDMLNRLQDWKSQTHDPAQTRQLEEEQRKIHEDVDRINRSW